MEVEHCTRLTAPILLCYERAKEVQDRKLHSYSAEKVQKPA